MKLFSYWRSSAAWRVRIALSWKGIPHGTVPVHLVREGGQQYSESYHEVNPQERVPALERRHGLTLELVYNDKALEWNNCYSLWVAREAFSEGVLLANGDTVHPASVEESLLAARGPELLIAVDDVKPLGAEEMKVHVTEEGYLDRINKALDPASAQGEYIGVTLIEPHAAGPLAGALEATFGRDPQLYYEDGFQELADRGGRVATAPIGTVAWVEVDDHADLEVTVLRPRVVGRTGARDRLGGRDGRQQGRRDQPHDGGHQAQEQAAGEGRRGGHVLLRQDGRAVRPTPRPSPASGALRTRSSVYQCLSI